MKIYTNRIEWGDDCYFYWFDYIENPSNRLLGYERVDSTHMLCFWWFCMLLKLK